MATRRILGLRLSAMVEVAFFLAAALAIALALGIEDRFAGISPHPFWILVLLIPVYYGVNEGLMAAAAASLTLLTMNMPDQAFGESVSNWLLRATSEPVMWFVAAIVLGGIRDGQRRERNELAGELETTREQARVITQSYDRLARLKTELEAAVAGQTRTAASVCEAAMLLSPRSVPSVLEAVGQFLDRLIEPLAFSLYLREGDGLVLVPGSRVYDQGCQSGMDPEAPIARLCLDKRQFLRIADPVDQLVLDGKAVFAGPLVDPRDDMVLGLITIDRIAEEHLTPATFFTFRAACRFIAHQLSEAGRRDAERQDAITAPGSLLGSPMLLEHQIGVLGALAEDMGFALSCLYLAVDHAKDGVDGLLVETAEQLLGRGACCFAYETDGWNYAVLLVGEDRAGADRLGQTLAGRLRAALSAGPGVADVTWANATLVEKPRPLRISANDR